MWVATKSQASLGPFAFSADQQCHPDHLRQLLWQPGAPSTADRHWGSPPSLGCLRPHPPTLPLRALPVRRGQRWWVAPNPCFKGMRKEWASCQSWWGCFWVVGITLGPCCPLPPERVLGFYCFASPQSTPESENLQNYAELWSSPDLLRSQRTAGGLPPPWFLILPSASCKEWSSARKWGCFRAVPVMGLAKGQSFAHDEICGFSACSIMCLILPDICMFVRHSLGYNTLTLWSHLILLDTCERETKGQRWELGAQSCSVTFPRVPVS